MKLGEIRIAKFKSFAGMTQFRLDDSVTALVGKNESGKTAALQALYRMNPLPSGHVRTFEGLRDYPRRSFAGDRDNVPSTEPISIDFTLEDDEVAAFEGAFGEGTLRHPSVKPVTR